MGTSCIARPKREEASCILQKTKFSKAKHIYGEFKTIEKKFTIVKFVKLIVKFELVIY